MFEEYSKVLVWLFVYSQCFTRNSKNPDRRLEWMATFWTWCRSLRINIVAYSYQTRLGIGADSKEIQEKRLKFCNWAWRFQHRGAHHSHDAWNRNKAEQQSNQKTLTHHFFKFLILEIHISSSTLSFQTQPANKVITIYSCKVYGKLILLG